MGKKTIYTATAFLAVIAVAVFALGGSLVQSTAANTQCASVQATISPPSTRLITAREYFAQANDAYDRGNCEGAIALYSQALALKPAFAEAYNNRAYTYMVQNRYAPALADLNKALALRPSYVHALMNRGDIYNYYYHIDRKRALRDYDRVIALGAARGTSVCGHRVLALHDGWNPGTVLGLIADSHPKGC